jgi:hypothetical protein
MIAQINAFFMNPKTNIAISGEKSIPIPMGGIICWIGLIMGSVML